jgi:hypothetical protein
MKSALIESPSGLDRYHYQLTGNGRVKRTKYEGDMQKREADWNRVRSEILSYAAARAHYQMLVNQYGWARV